MKALRQFLTFDIDRFLCDKTLVVVSISDLIDYDSTKIVGTKVECAIIKDDTPYILGKDGQAITNLYEKLVIKIRYPHTVDVTVGTEVTPINATATVYGDYSNKLSVTAEGLAVKHVNKDKG